MKRKTKGFLIGLFSGILLLSGGITYMAVTQPSIQALYPRAEETFVGDPMPYADGSKYQIYYLEDFRDGKIGFHPFSLFETKDFYHYEHTSNVIPYVNEEKDPERALGTGSIIKDQDGQFHAFYTAHNDVLDPKEKIMHALSPDGKKWTKQPKDTFQASTNYEGDDFRDPYVFYHEETHEYWMLITTRKAGRGVIARYTSKDLSNWSDQGVFFVNDLGTDANLECPSLVQFEGKWYLAFSDQWDQRVVHYRIAQTATGDFKKPSGLDHVDGQGFYAGRLVTNGQQLYLTGWIPTKENHRDGDAYNWAGNLATHQLEVDGQRLVPRLPQTAAANLKQQAISVTNKALEISATEQATVYQTEVAYAQQKKIILSFAQENRVIIDFEQKEIRYVQSTEPSAQPLAAIRFEKAERMDLKIVKEGDIVVVYFGNQALSNRIYAAKTGKWTIQAE